MPTLPQADIDADVDSDEDEEDDGEGVAAAAASPPAVACRRCRRHRRCWHLIRCQPVPRLGLRRERVGRGLLRGFAATAFVGVVVWRVQSIQRSHLMTSF